MEHAVSSALKGGDEVEILIVDDGSKDGTAAIADALAEKHPGIIRVFHQENGGHGAAVMTGIRNATGLYFKVVDSDDWLDEEALPRVLETLRGFVQEPLDMMISDFVYDKVGAKHKHIMSFGRKLPRRKVFGWDDIGRFGLGRYILMHSVIYRTQMLRDCGLELPRHTFYVDELYVYVPLKDVRRIYYLDVKLYHYFIGRDDQSVQEAVMIRRIDQALKVNYMLFTSLDPYTVSSPLLQTYMISYLEIVTSVSSVLLFKSRTKENLEKKKALWDFLAKQNPRLYQELRHRLFGRILHLPGKAAPAVSIFLYHLSHLIYGFN